MLKPYNELRKVDVSEYCMERDGIKYLNWAKCMRLSDWIQIYREWEAGRDG